MMMMMMFIVELVASSADEFVDIARRLSSDPARLRELRGSLRDTLAKVVAARVRCLLE